MGDLKEDALNAIEAFELDIKSAENDRDEALKSLRELGEWMKAQGHQPPCWGRAATLLMRIEGKGL